MDQEAKRAAWLKPGEQTELTDRIQALAAQIKVPEHVRSGLNHPELAVAQRTAVFIHRRTHLAENRAFRNKYFRKRTADQIAQYGIYPTCSDEVLLFRALMIAQGVPTLYAESVLEGNIPRGRNSPRASSHAGTNILLRDGREIIYEPYTEDVFFSEEALFERRGYILLAKGLDSWDLDIRGWDDVQAFRHLHAREARRKADYFKASKEAASYER
ncbi:MAG: hypothetical protein H6502_04585 [Candidatus Woesearchaeota archaeon]|nr:MAG: hypothetical protein H6502_04585 [Candidatus Woesearchaeota archaeon]